MKPMMAFFDFNLHFIINFYLHCRYLIFVLFSLFLIKFSLGNELLSKETIGLPEIIKILGERPFGMSATMKDYLKEMEKRKTQED